MKNWLAGIWLFALLAVQAVADSDERNLVEENKNLVEENENLIEENIIETPAQTAPAAVTLPAASKSLTPQSCLQFAEFRQEKYLTGLPKPLVTRGKVVVDCERGTVWSTDKPIRETLVYQMDGKQWLIKSATDKQEIKNAVQKRVGTIISRIMRGDESFINKYFARETIENTTRLVPSQKRLKKYIHNIDLQPQDAGMRVQVKRVDEQDMVLELSNMRPLTQLDAASCATLLQSTLGCDLIFPSPAK